MAKLLPAAFTELASEVLREYPEVKYELSIERGGKHSELYLARASERGFDIRIVCETYGIYPQAGKWWGSPYDYVIREQDIELSLAVLGLVRDMLCRDSRLIYTYRRRKVIRAALELRRQAGWVEEDRSYPQLALPLGERRVVVLQNDQLPPRFPYEGLTPTGWNTYAWENHGA